jgi:hypothetical protein
MNTPDSESSGPEPSGLQVELGAKSRRHLRQIWFVTLSALALAAASIASITLIGRSPGPSPEPSPSPSAVLQKSPQPKITWSENQLEVILSPGETATRSLTFSSDQNLQNSLIDPVPELAPFLTVTPKTFTNVPANIPQSVQVNFAIAPGATLGTYDGTIHVAADNPFFRPTVPLPLKVTLFVWQLVEDDTTGIRFRIPNFGGTARTVLIPPTFAIDPTVLVVEVASGSLFVQTFGIGIYNNEDRLSLEEWFRERIDPDQILTQAGTFEARTIGDLLALVRVSPVPRAYMGTGSTVDEAYGISPDGEHILTISTPQESALSDLGYENDDISDLLVRVLSTVMF